MWNKSQWTGLGVWLRGYMCLLFKQKIWVQTPASTWKTARACHDSIVGVEGRWFRTCQPAHLVEQQVGEDTKVMLWLIQACTWTHKSAIHSCACTTQYVCVRAHIYAHTKKIHHWAELELCHMTIVISAPWMLRRETLTSEASSDA